MLGLRCSTVPRSHSFGLSSSTLVCLSKSLCSKKDITTISEQKHNKRLQAPVDADFTAACRETECQCDRGQHQIFYVTLYLPSLPISNFSAGIWNSPFSG